MTRFGLRVAWNQPAVVLAEIVWRWCFGAASLLVLTVCAVHYLHSLVVTDAEMDALRTNQPWIVATAVQQIFAGSGPLLLRIALIAVPAMLFFWWIAASIGRTVTLRALMPARPARMTTQFGVHFLRTLNSLVALGAVVISAYLAGLVAVQGEEPNPAVFMLVFMLLLALVFLIRSAINYFLSLASVTAAQGSLGAGRASLAALALFRRRGRALSSLELAIAFWKFVAAIVVTVLSFIPAVLINVTPWPVWVGLLVLLTLLYFVIADFLSLARLIAWLAIAETDTVPAEMKTAGAVTPAV